MDSRQRMTSMVSGLTLAIASLLLGCAPGPGGDGEPIVGLDLTPTDTPADAERKDRTELAAGGQRAARAAIRPTEGNSVTGTVGFRETGGGLAIHVEVAQLTPGLHGLHIHEKGDCSAGDASSAGGHYAPRDNPHGSPVADRHHAGDLGNIEADQDGVAVADFVSDDLTLSAANPIMGRAVIVHRGADDFETQPGGAAGDRIGCGRIDVID